MSIPWAPILEFWFGDESDDARVAASQAGLWWGKDPAVDREIRDRFAGSVERAAAGELDHWGDEARGKLALILLCDQFPRNIHRDTPRAFATDERALGYATALIDSGKDRELRAIERVFVLLPLEHSENIEHQDRCVEAMRRLASSVPDAQSEPFDTFVDFAERHRDVIARFGRFPHRNRILGRESTDAERTFLQQPGSSF